jgi:hypothetical protein
LEYEIACDRLCDRISDLLLDGTRPPTRLAAFAAGRATQDLAAAFHHAAGLPADELWSSAVESLEHFLDMRDNLKLSDSAAMRELRRFVAENADALASNFELKLAS